MDNSYCVARVTGARDVAAALRPLVGGQVQIDAGTASSDDGAIRDCRMASPLAIVVRQVEGGQCYLGCALPMERGDARTLVDLLRRAIKGGDREPLPDTVLDRWRTAIRDDPPAAGIRYWQRLAALAATGASPKVSAAGLRVRSRRALPAEVNARLDERFLAGGEATVLGYASACWLVTIRRAVGGAVQSLSLLVDRRSRPELERVVGLTHHWLPLVESLDDRVQFSTLERMVATAREIGSRWQEQIPDDFPVIGTGLDVVAFERIEGEGVTCEIVDLGGWADDMPLTLRVIRADGHWYLDLAYTGEPPEPLLPGWEHVLKIAAAQPLSELALAAADVGDSAPPAALDVVDAIERWQADRPEDVAIIDATGQLTVGELWRAAGELSADLSAGTAVGIRCDRDRSFAIAALAVLRAGAYFVPLTIGGEVWDRDDGMHAVIAGNRIETSGTGKRQLSGDEKFAYAMRTSGSMGVPKLALISRPTLAAATARVAEFVGVSETDRYLHLASFGFSSSVRQMFVPLTRRATVLLAPEAARTNVAELMSWLGQVRPTIIDTTPTMLDAVAAAGCSWPPSIRAVLSASEQLDSVDGGPLPGGHRLHRTAVSHVRHDRDERAGRRVCRRSRVEPLPVGAVAGLSPLHSRRLSPSRARRDGRRVVRRRRRRQRCLCGSAGDGGVLRSVVTGGRSADVPHT